MLRLQSFELADPLQRIFVASLESSTMPDCWKTAVISSIFKKGNPSIAANIGLFLLQHLSVWNLNKCSFPIFYGDYGSKGFWAAISMECWRVGHPSCSYWTVWTSGLMHLTWVFLLMSFIWTMPRHLTRYPIPNFASVGKWIWVYRLKDRTFKTYDPR